VLTREVRRRSLPQDVEGGRRTAARPDDAPLRLAGPLRLVGAGRTVAIVTRYPGDTHTLADALAPVLCPPVVRSGALTASMRVWGRVPAGEWSKATTLHREHPDVCDALAGYAETIAAAYRELAPREYTVQSAQVRAHRLAPTAPWTTGSVNRATATAYHRDTVNRTGSWSGMLVLRGGGAGGGELVLPEYGVALDLADGDVLFFDGGATYHGNLPLSVPPGGWRYSLPCYALRL
jgi:hypothetical protein